MKKILFLLGLLYFCIVNSNAQKNKTYFTFPTEEKIIYDICFTANGGVIGIGDDKAIKLYSMETKELIRELDNEHTGQILSIDISNDSTKLVSGGKDSTIILPNIRTTG